MCNVNAWGAQRLVMLPLTSRGHGTEAEGGGGRGQAELVQHGVGARRVDHRDIAGGAQAGHHPHRALAERRRRRRRRRRRCRWRMTNRTFGNMTRIYNGGYGSVWCSEEEHRCHLRQDGHTHTQHTLTTASPEISAITATAQLSCRSKATILEGT